MDKHIVILATLLAALAIAIGNANGTDLSAESIEQLDNRLIGYLDDHAFQELQVNYLAQIKWIMEIYDERDTGIHITLRQFEISMRNRAVKLYLVDLLRRICREQFNHRPQVNVDASLLEAKRDLLVARAMLRAKLMMIRANQLHWLALQRYFENFKVYYKPAEVKRLGSLMPKESLELSKELGELTRAYERFCELSQTKSTMGEIMQVLDRLLDEYTGCRTCHELTEERWSRAARLHRNFMVREWLLEYVEPEVRLTWDKEYATFIENKQLRVLSLNVLKDQFDQEAMEKWRRKTLG